MSSEFFMLPSWLIIGIIATLIAVVALKLNTADGIRWFNRQRRPSWLTFERAIPFIWTTIFICGAWSAYIAWEAEPRSTRTWFLMLLYALTEIVIMAYNPAMAWIKSLKLGVWVGGLGFVFGLVLATLVYESSIWATVLLVPYLLWSPIGTYVTWVMAEINHPNHRS
jgi:translocator protein